MPPIYHQAAQKISDALRNKGVMLTTAESCTGGLIAGSVTDLAGSSDVFDRGFVTYSNDAKVDMLSVSRETIGEHGAVSPQTATEMAIGALKNSNAKIAVSVTGIAGPGGGTADKPVGLVYIGIAMEGAEPVAHQCNFCGSRTEIREKTVLEALTLLLKSL